MCKFSIGMVTILKTNAQTEVQTLMTGRLAMPISCFFFLQEVLRSLLVDCSSNEGNVHSLLTTDSLQI